MTIAQTFKFHASTVQEITPFYFAIPHLPQSPLSERAETFMKVWRRLQELFSVGNLSFKQKWRIHTLEVVTVKVERNSTTYMQNGKRYWHFGLQKQRAACQKQLWEGQCPHLSISFIKIGTGRTVVMGSPDQKISIHQGKGRKFIWKLSGDSQ